MAVLGVRWGEVWQGGGVLVAPQSQWYVARKDPRGFPGFPEANVLLVLVPCSCSMFMLLELVIFQVHVVDFFQIRPSEESLH